MYAAIRRYKVKAGAAEVIAQRAQEGFCQKKAPFIQDRMTRKRLDFFGSKRAKGMLTG
jgi:hypothetical protein